MKNNWSERYDSLMKEFDETYKEVVFKDNSVSLFTSAEHYITYHVKMMFLNTPKILLVTGDYGTWVFGNISKPQYFFRGKFANIGYWSEKVISMSRFGSPIISETIDENDIRKEIEDWLISNEIDEEKKEEVLDNLSACDHLYHNSFCIPEIEEAFLDADVEIEIEDIVSMVNNCETYSEIFIYICVLLQWVENKKEFEAFAERLNEAV